MERDKIELDTPTLEKILKLVHHYTGITMASTKKTLIQGRLGPRVRELNLTAYSAYIEYLQSHKSEVQEFINLVTTNETSFFRTQRVWDFFNNEFLPKYFAQNPQKILKIWSAASSSGEEVYTIGICCEEFRAKNPSFNYQILGTDISSDMLALAEKGEYSGRSIENFKNGNPLVFNKHLELRGDKYRVSAQVKSKIRFAPHNLFNPPPQTKAFDIVFIRNVLIYFEAPDQEKVLQNMNLALAENSVL